MTNETSAEHQWIRHWALLTGLMIVVGVLFPLVQPYGGDIRLFWIWDGLTEMPWAVATLVVILLLLHLLPLILRSTVPGRALPAALLAYSGASSVLSGFVFTLAFGSSMSFMGTPAGGAAALAFFVPVALLIAGMAASNHLVGAFPNKRYPRVYLGIVSGLFVAAFVLTMLTPAGFRGELLVEKLFFSSNSWEDGWFVLISILLIFLYGILALIRALAGMGARLVSDVLWVVMIIIPVVLIVGTLIEIGELDGQKIMVTVGSFLKGILLIYGLFILLGASICSLVRQSEAA